MADGKVVTPREAAKQHVLPAPYVVKPVAEGSSVGVFIVPRGPRASAPGAQRSRLGVRRRVAGRALSSPAASSPAPSWATALGVTEIVPAETLRFYNFKGRGFRRLRIRIEDA